jgi:hypothetical protein
MLLVAGCLHYAASFICDSLSWLAIASACCFVAVISDDDS